MTERRLAFQPVLLAVIGLLPGGLPAQAQPPMSRPAPPPAVHRVIQAPAAPIHAPGVPAGSNASHRPPHRPPHTRLWHGRIEAVPATVPQAQQKAAWKSPYSYGYFGASGKRHWSKHHGYRQRYTEWRLW